jgi:MSHA biogenesis protein MshO
MTRRLQSGFTLVELVVSIAITSIVLVFVGMFLAAPLGAYEHQSRRNAMVGDVSTAWPRFQEDLRDALPNSIRTRVNGNYVVVEMMTVAGVTRYTGAANINSTNIAIAGSPSDAVVATGALSNPASVYLAVNPNTNVYSLSGSITNTRRTVSWTTTANGSGAMTVNTAPNFTAGNSSRNRLYLVRGPVTYLCDLRAGQQTLRRYAGYAVAAVHTARDAPNEFGTATSNELIARGITGCAFTQSNTYPTKPQTVAVRLTATRSGESVTLLHESRAEYLP